MAGGDATPSTHYWDKLRIAATFDEGATDEYVYYEKDVDNYSSNTSPVFLIRYKTSASSAGAHAKVVLDFTAGTQIILDNAYSTTWTTVTGAITPAKTIDKIRFYADDDGTNGTFYVYYDFLLLHKGIFTWPYCDNVNFISPNRINKLGVPGRVGDITQYGGSESASVHVTGTMDTGTGWYDEVDTIKPGSYLYKVVHDMRTDPWQWFTSDVCNMKTSVDRFEIGQIKDSGVQRVYDLLLSEYRHGTAVVDGVLPEGERYYERFGLV